MRRKDSSFKPGCALRLSFALRYSWSSAACNTANEHPKTCKTRHTPYALSGRQTLTSDLPLLAPGLYTAALLKHSGMIESSMSCHKSVILMSTHCNMSWAELSICYFDCSVVVTSS